MIALKKLSEAKLNQHSKQDIILLKHHPMNLKYTNTWYTSQVADDLKNYVVIDVTSRVLRDKGFMSQHPSFHKDVSPFYIGPVISSDGLTAHVYEHFWQASKVFPCHVDDLGNIKEEYWVWRKEWFDKERVVNKTVSRRPHSLLGYKDSDCLFSVYFNNGTWERLSYVEARKKIYIVEYAKYVVKTNGFKWMQKLYNEGKKLALVDFDGYNFYYDYAKEKLYNSYINKCKKDGVKPTKTLQDFLNLKTINDVIDCEFTPAGHCFIIKMLLEGDLEVKNNQVIDHIGVLNINRREKNMPLFPQRKENSYAIN